MVKNFRIIVLGCLMCASSVFADIERVSVSSSGTEGNDDVDSFYSFSADGRFVAFYSSRAIS